MNYYSLITEDIVDTGIVAETFCRKRLRSNAKNLTCKKFFMSLPDGGRVVVCPYGLCAVKVPEHVLCGFKCETISDETHISKMNDHGSFLRVRYYSAKSIEIVINALRLKAIFDFYSYFAHDIAHEISVLKTHLDELEPLRSENRLIENAMLLYADLLSVYDEYKHHRIDMPKLQKGWFLDENNLPNYVAIMEKKKGQYQSLVERFTHCLSIIRPKAEVLNDEIVEYDFDNKTKHLVQSLLIMHSLFQYRIQYTKESISLAQCLKANRSKSCRISLRKSLYKLVMFLKPESKRQGLRGIYLGCDRDVEITAPTSLYLVFYILLENALKYAIENTAVQALVIIQSNDTAVVRVENSSDYISEESIKRLEEPGFSGENSIHKDSHGFGLAIVQRILSGSGVSVDYSYNKETSLFSADLSFRLN